MCPLLAHLIIGLLFFHFLLRLFTVLMKQTRQVLCPVKQPIFLDVYDCSTISIFVNFLVIKRYTKSFKISLPFSLFCLVSSPCHPTNVSSVCLYYKTLQIHNLWKMAKFWSKPVCFLLLVTNALFWANINYGICRLQICDVFIVQAQSHTSYIGSFIQQIMMSFFLMPL